MCKRMSRPGQLTRVKTGEGCFDGRNEWANARRISHDDLQEIGWEVGMESTPACHRTVHVQTEFAFIALLLLEFKEPSTLSSVELSKYVSKEAIVMAEVGIQHVVGVAICHAMACIPMIERGQTWKKAQ